MFIDADHESEIKKWGHRLRFCATAILKRVFSQEISTVFYGKVEKMCLKSIIKKVLVENFFLFLNMLSALLSSFR